LEQLLVRRPLLVRHLQLHLLPARGPDRDQAAGGGLDRRRGPRLRARRLAGVGAVGALLEPDVHAALARRRALGRVPVRTRCHVRAARDRRPAARPTAALRTAALPDAAREPTRPAAARARTRRPPRRN